MNRVLQFGEKKVRCHSGDGFKVDAQDTTLVAMTVEVGDWKENWTEVTKSTYRFFRQQPFLAEVLVNVWGRSYRRGKAATSADDCTSVQVHMLIKSEALLGVLKAAGAACIWATPKSKDGGIDHSWKLIWLDAKLDPQSIAVTIAKIQDAAGVVRIKGRHAVRVAKTAYAKAWSTLYPGTAQPELIDANMTFKIDSLPYGVTREMLTAWSKHVQWPLLRAVGPKSWVVGAMEAPPQQTLFFNSAPLLVKEITAKQPPMNPIIAGPRPKATTSDLPPLKTDPWAPALSSSPWANYTGLGNVSVGTASAVPGQVGPTEQKFAAQEDRIQKLEHALKTVQQDQKETKGAIQAVHTELGKRDQLFQAHLDSRLADMKKEIDSSFSQALKHQSSSWESGFLELKQLLATRDKRPREEDMQQDWLPCRRFMDLDFGILDSLPSFALLHFWALVVLWSEVCFRFHFLIWSPVFLCLGSLFVGVHGFVNMALLRYDGDLLPWLFHCRVDPAFLVRPALGAGFRFGEALNPGPDSKLRFCVTNPTCVSNKFDAYWDLVNLEGCNVISLSETAATQSVQLQLSAKFKFKKCTFVWGPAVPPLTNTTTGVAHTRGRASGVALLANVATRPSRLDTPPEWEFSSRFTHGIVQFGQSHVQVAVLYCKPVHGHVGIDFNSALLQCALDQLKLLPLPFVIMGDFNMNVNQFHAWESLSSCGCMSLTELYGIQNADPMPPTCNGVTWPDNAILSPELVGCISNIRVLDATWFATHCPVVFDLQIKGHTIFQHKLKLPRTFVDLALDDDALALMDSDSWFCQVDSLSEWAQAVEHGVHVALVNGSGSKSSLPKSFRGRCRPIRVVRTPINSPVRVACEGAYEPSTEVLTMPCRRKVKQVRRLEAWYKRVVKLCRDPQTPLQKEAVSSNAWTQLTQEWSAICNSTAFGLPFLQWLSQFPDMDFPAYPLPSAAWVYEAQQVSKHFLECALRDDLRIQQARCGFHQHLDKSNQYKAAYARVRGPGPPPVSQLVRETSFDVLVVSDAAGCLHDCFADAADISQLDSTFPVCLFDVACTIVKCDTHVVQIATSASVDWTDQTITLSQRQLLMHPMDVAKELDKFWLPIWQKSPADLSFVDQELHHMEFRSFLEHMPVPAAMDVSLLDLGAWKASIKKLKSSSARGTDGISAQELKMLPDAAIRSLAAILDSSDQPFGIDFMNGLVAPLSKAGVDTPHFGQTRPITILPQVYRVWAAVLCSQIARVFALWAPAAITGFLPHRGSTKAAMQAQWDIEKARHKREPLLDLKKCFNHISWAFAYHALKACGVPVRFLRLWITMQSQLHRFWLINGEIFVSGQGSSGLPEGDQWSVLAMIAISVGWVSFVSYHLGHSHVAKLAAYADNWSWTSHALEEHPLLLRLTIQYTAAVGLSIDWHKTWCWSTSKAHARLLESSLFDATAVHVTVKNSAPDLGFQMQYGGRNQVGLQADRTTAGLSRISRLAGLDYGLAIKEQILLASIYPVALHGSEIKPPVQETFAKFRSHAARALYGDAHSISPAIALLFGKKGILDPEFVFLCHLVASVRRFVATLSQDARVDFFAIASRFHGSLASAHGPAASLAFAFQQIGWQVTSTGLVHVGAFLSFSLLDCSLQRFKRFLSLTWQCKLVQSFTCRYSWFQYPDISVCDTRAVLNGFQDPQRKRLIREISGGYQLESQKKHWLNESSGVCPFCPDLDSRRHRLAECVLGRDIRAPFTDVLLDADASGSCVVDFPVVCVHPGVEALSLAHHQFSLVSWEPEVHVVLTRFHQSGITPCFFTDGSCQFPVSPTTRFSAFAVILDLCHNDDERCHIADRFRYEGDFKVAFQVISTDVTPGEQDILRAELTAIVDICLNTTVGIIHVDSQSALQLAELALSATTPTEFLDKEHFDLLLLLFHRRDRVHFSFRKVKAHRDLTAIQAPLLRFAAMGNWYADAVAESTRDNKCPTIVKEHLQMHSELSQDQDRLAAVYRLHLQLLEHRGRALAQEDHSSLPLVDSQSLWEQFAQWQIPDSNFVIPDADLSLLSYSPFGDELATMTFQWLKQLRWPRGNKGPGELVAGTTWIELGLDWMCFHKRFLPVLREDQRGVLRLQLLPDFAAAKDAMFSFNEAGTMIEKLIRNITALVPEDIFPTVPRGKVSSLYLLGSTKYFQGLTLRVQLAAQSDVFELLRQALQGDQTAKGLTGVPRLFSASGETGRFEQPWKERCAAGHKGMYRCRQIRKTLWQTFGLRKCCVLLL